MRRITSRTWSISLHFFQSSGPAVDPTAKSIRCPISYEISGSGNSTIEPNALSHRFIDAL